jgi:hypothetical protein
MMGHDDLSITDRCSHLAITRFEGRQEGLFQHCRGDDGEDIK